jgi:FAD/FMN-containing dehydrogenase
MLPYIEVIKEKVKHLMEFNYSGLTGDVITRDDCNYEIDRRQWNRSIEKYPLVIVYCLNKKDIENAICWARENSVSARIRSGGHHYEGYSTDNDVIVIDVSRMKGISIDEDKEIVKIDGGVRNREMYEALGAKGYPFPGGGCPTVGVVGFTLGGGWGYSCRFLGFGCDSLTEVELIDYTGKAIIANKKYNSDLFWACTGGGGGNFGVVTSMTFALPKKINKATLINMEYPNMTRNGILEVFNVWQEIFNQLDERMNIKLAIYNSRYKGIGVKITGVFYGHPEEANKLLMPFKAILANMNINMEYTTVLEVNRKIQDSHPDYESYKSTGRFIHRDYTKEEMMTLIDLIDNRAEGAIYTALSLYGLGGAISKIDKNETAFYYRDAIAIMGLQSVWEEEKYATFNRKWVIDKVRYIESVTVGSFINFPFKELTNYESEYYGENMNRLRFVKEKYDPEDIFSFPQGIRANGEL